MFNNQRYLNSIYCLDTYQYKKYIDNIILLSSTPYKRSDDKFGYITYENIIHLGKNVKKYIQTKDNENTHLQKSSNAKFILILTTMESFKLQKNINVIDNNFNKVSDNNNYPLLSSIIFGSRYKDQTNLLSSKKYKRSTIIGSGKHFGSSGACYGFGLRASYKLEDNNFSVGPFANKKETKKLIKEEIENELAKIRISVNEEITMASKDQEQLLVNSIMIGNGISTSINSIMDQFKHDEYRSINENCYKYFSARYVNVDSSTKEYHNDKDAGTTIISVPKQNISNIGYIQFSFKINSNRYVLIPMVEGVSIHFNDKYISHRQQRFLNSNFLNISGYTNNHLIRNMCSSLKRKISNMSK